MIDDEAPEEVILDALRSRSRLTIFCTSFLIALLLLSLFRLASPNRQAPPPAGSSLQDERRRIPQPEAAIDNTTNTLFVHLFSSQDGMSSLYDVFGEYSDYRTVVYNQTTSQFTLIDGVHNNIGLCWGKIKRNPTGEYWSQLYLHMSSFSQRVTGKSLPLLGAEALGFLEGALSCRDIDIFYSQYVAYLSHQIAQLMAVTAPHISTTEHLSKARHLVNEVKAWLEDNFNWIHNTAIAKTSEHTKIDAELEFWRQILLILAQLQGLHKGYMECIATWNTDHMVAEHEPLQFADFLLINAQRSVIHIIQALEPSLRPQWRNISRREDVIRTLDVSGTRGVAFFKLLPQTKDVEVFVSHTTPLMAVSHSSSLWLYKHVRSAMGSTPLSHPYKTKRGHKDSDDDDEKKNYRDPSSQTVAATRISFPSLPGMLASSAAFYITNSGLVVAETGCSLLDGELYEDVSIEAVLPWLRELVATRMAKTAEYWRPWFDKHAKRAIGCHQYTIVDYKTLRGTRTDIAQLAHALHVVEQAGRKVANVDATATLASKGFFSTFGLPMQKSVFAVAGYNALAKQWGEFGYWTHWRYVQLAEAQAKVDSMEELHRLVSEAEALWPPGVFAEDNDVIVSATTTTSEAALEMRVDMALFDAISSSSDMQSAKWDSLQPTLPPKRRSSD